MAQRLHGYELERNVRIGVLREQIDAVIAELGATERQVRSILRMAVNDTARPARTDIIRQISSAWNIAQADLRRRNVFFHGATNSKLTAYVNIRGGRIPLARFSPTPSRMNPTAQRRVAGTAVRVTRGASVVQPHAFTITTRRGYTGVYRRTGDGRNRLHLTELRGPTVPQMMQQTPGLERNVLDRMLQERLQGRIEHLIDVFLVQRNARGTNIAEQQATEADNG